ncbi:MAG: HAD-IIB family hydrolase [Angustibacter sp.]
MAMSSPGSPSVVLFDLDDTLAPSKTTVAPEMAGLLADLLVRVPVCVISGGRFEQFRDQLLEPLALVPGVDDRLHQLHLMPTCGTRYHTWQDGRWQLIYAEDLADEAKRRVVAALTDGARELGLQEPRTWGPVIEDRGSQITFSALGQSAPVHAKRVWDPTGERKEELRRFVADRVPDLEVRSGGSTSVDVTRKGVDKAFGVRRLCAALGVGLPQLLFIGDRLDEGGNDYPVKALGVRCIAVTGPAQTAGVVTDLLRELDGSRVPRPAPTSAQPSGSFHELDGGRISR